MPSKKPKSEGWFESLDSELEQSTRKLERDITEKSTQKHDMNKTVIEDFWKILLRFEKIGIHFSMEPSHDLFARFEKFPYEYEMKETFDFANTNSITLTDRTRDQGRTGDALKIRYYLDDGVQHMRLVFEYCEGEHYYKYSGWKRMYSQYVLYDMPMGKVGMDELHDILGSVIKVWYESHLKRSRSILLAYMKETFEKGESFAQ
ncbi:MAG: hypothetical protein HZB92_06160 [Euryarchaeota archaeon]|nr:hypothetical protein [Euryarchaeota archaeon]